MIEMILTKSGPTILVFVTMKLITIINMQISCINLYLNIIKKVTWFF